MKGYARRYFALIMAACMMLFSVPFARAEQTGFVDMPGEGHWSYAALNSAVENGILNGNNNHLYPNRALTREQMAQILYNIFQKYVNTAGTYTGDEAGNVMVNVPEVTIKDASISGDLIIGDGVGSGTVTLDHVTVSGRVLVRGGGENSLRIVNNSNIGSIIVTKSSSGDLRDGCLAFQGRGRLEKDSG